MDGQPLGRFLTVDNLCVMWIGERKMIANLTPQRLNRKSCPFVYDVDTTECRL